MSRSLEVGVGIMMITLVVAILMGQQEWIPEQALVP
jgi:hypothetical protein